MTGTKFGCGVGLCGACTVHIDGVAVRSCITLIDGIGDSAITTIEESAPPFIERRVETSSALLHLLDFSSSPLLTP